MASELPPLFIESLSAQRRRPSAASSIGASSAPLNAAELSRQATTDNEAVHANANAGATCTFAPPRPPGSTTVPIAIPRTVDAAAEVRRLNDLQETLNNDLQRLRPRLKPDHAILRSWLDANEDVSLSDAGIGTSQISIKELRIRDEDEVKTVGRYEMRPELKQWMDRVSTLDHRTSDVAGEWRPQDVELLDEEVVQHVRDSLSHSAAVKQTRHTSLILQICEQLHQISDGRDFAIDTHLLPDDTKQLARLADYVSEWHQTTLRIGHPYALAEEEIDRRVREHEASLAAQRAAIVRVAEAEAGLLLTAPQVDQLLNAVLEDARPSHFLSRAEQDATLRTVAHTQARQAMLEQKIHRQAAVARSGGTRAPPLQRSNTTSAPSASSVGEGLDLRPDETEEVMQRRDAVAQSEARRTQLHDLASILARQHVRAAEAKVAALEETTRAAQDQCEEATRLVRRIEIEYQEQQAQLRDLLQARQKANESKERHEAEMARVHGGQLSHHQRVAATLADVVSETTTALLGLTSVGADVSLPPSKRQALLDRVTQWARRLDVLPCVPDGLRSVCREVLAEAKRWYPETDSGDGESAAAPAAEVPSKGTDAEATRQRMVDGVMRRLDMASSELQTKHREIRYMQKVLQYFAAYVTSIIDRSEDEFLKPFRNELSQASHSAIAGPGAAPRSEQVRFPPDSVVGNDGIYAVAWSDEVKALGRLAVQVRGRLADDADHTAGSTNALLSAVQVVAEDALMGHRHHHHEGPFGIPTSMIEGLGHHRHELFGACPSPRAAEVKAKGRGPWHHHDKDSAATSPKGARAGVGVQLPPIGYSAAHARDVERRELTKAAGSTAVVRRDARMLLFDANLDQAGTKASPAGRLKNIEENVKQQREREGAELLVPASTTVLTRDTLVDARKQHDAQQQQRSKQHQQRAKSTPPDSRVDGGAEPLPAPAGPYSKAVRARKLASTASTKPGL